MHCFYARPLVLWYCQFHWDRSWSRFLLERSGSWSFFFSHQRASQSSILKSAIQHFKWVCSLCHLSAKSRKRSCCDSSSSSQTRDSGCRKIIGGPPEIHEVSDGWERSVHQASLTVCCYLVFYYLQLLWSIHKIEALVSIWKPFQKMNNFLENLGTLQNPLKSLRPPVPFSKSKNPSNSNL